MKETDLNAELREKGGIYFKGVDKAGRPIRKQAVHILLSMIVNTHVLMTSRLAVHMKVNRNKRGHLVEEAKEFIAFHIFQHYKDNPAQQITILFDFFDSSVSNMVRHVSIL